MFRRVAERLDQWVVQQNLNARDEGLARLRPSTIRLLGQMALLEARVPLTLAATNDVEAYTDCPQPVEIELKRLLAEHGKELDPLGHEIWMPRETRYTTLYAGEFVTLELADADAVLISKARMAPEKNKPLLIEYLAGGPSDRFLELAGEHGVDLETFVR